MAGKRFSKNMVRRIALSGDVANAYALGRTMQEKHTPFVNASAVQIYGDGTRLHTLKSGSYRRLYATGGRERLYQQAGSMIFPWQMHFVIDAAKQCYFIGRDPDAGVAANWMPVFEGVKMRAVVPEFGFTLFLAEDGRLWGIGGYQEAGWAVGEGLNLAVWPPARLTPFDDWEIVSTENSEMVLGVRRNGTLWAWGNDAGFILQQTSHSAPIQITELTDWVWCDSYQNQNSAMRKNGETWVWGLTIGAGEGYLSLIPAPLLGVNKKHVGYVQRWPYKTQYAPNSFYALAIFDDGRLYYAGDPDLYGPPGLNTDEWTPVSAKKDWWFVEARDIRPAFAVDLSGDLYAYGDMLIDDSLGHTTGWGAFIIGGVQQVTLYDRTAIVLKKDGTLWGWGESDDGGLGSVTPIVYPPRQLGTDSDWAWVDISNYTVVAAKKNGDRYWSGFMGRNTPTGIATNTVITTLIPIAPDDSSWIEDMQYRDER